MGYFSFYVYNRLCIRSSTILIPKRKTFTKNRRKELKSYYLFRLSMVNRSFFIELTINKDKRLKIDIIAQSENALLYVSSKYPEATGDIRPVIEKHREKSAKAIPLFSTGVT